jgi:DNA-binding LacI/PurR family transcriptional regulator
MARGVPVVEADRRMSTSCDAVVIDNGRGARDAVAHLLELGHTRIALLVARTTWTTDAGRLDGYRAALAEAGLRVERKLVLKLATHAPDAEARIQALVEEQRPTAVFAANNVLAAEAWHVLRRLGRKIPQHVSLVAFDDVPWMEMVQPALTAVRQPAYEMGRRAALLLLRRLADPTCGRTIEVLQPELVVRGSTAPPWP